MGGLAEEVEGGGARRASGVPVCFLFEFSPPLVLAAAVVVVVCWCRAPTQSISEFFSFFFTPLFSNYLRRRSSWRPSRRWCRARATGRSTEGPGASRKKKKRRELLPPTPTPTPTQTPPPTPLESQALAGAWGALQGRRHGERRAPTRTGAPPAPAASGEALEALRGSREEEREEKRVLKSGVVASKNFDVFFFFFCLARKS